MVRRHFVLFAFTAAFVGSALIGCSRKPTDVPEPKSLTVDEVDARIAAHDGKTFIFDNNDRDRYAKGHVPTARWVDFDAVTANDLPQDKTATLVFYCSNEL